ncbi:proton-transporting ATP synthase [Aureococcus anophagefferens]|nr:proton-transporting ATP synthase [Aureococcus anophagefferens]
MRLVAAAKKELEAQGIEVEIVPVGTKVEGYFRRRGEEFPASYSCPQVPSADWAGGLREMLNNFLDGETDKVELIYTKFVSLIASSAAPGVRRPELASRMQSMQSASDNAKDLKKSLSQTYNRIRQAGVTQEILEIVAGATAAQG